MKPLLLSLSLCALFAIPTTPSAAAEPQGAMQVSQIVAHQQQIQAEVLAGSGKYKDMPLAKREELQHKQQSLLALLDGKQSTDELSEEQRTEAFAAMAWIDGAADTAPPQEDRMVCERRQILGSNRKERVCMSAAQIKLRRERDQERMQNSSGDLTR